MWAVAQLGDTAEGAATDWNWEWIPAYEVSLALRLDALSELMVLLAAGIGALVLVYCVRYFNDGTRGLSRFAARCSPSPAPCSAWSSPTT